MPPEKMWQGFFDPQATLKKLGLAERCGDVWEFGCGYGTFTIPAAQMNQGTVYALDIDPERCWRLRKKKSMSLSRLADG